MLDADSLPEASGICARRTLRAQHSNPLSSQLAVRRIPSRETSSEIFIVLIILIIIIVLIVIFVRAMIYRVPL